MLFVLCGFEHSIANMYFLPLAAMIDDSITLYQVMGNIIAATIGNTISGAILIPCVYYTVHKSAKKQSIRKKIKYERNVLDIYSATIQHEN